MGKSGKGGVRKTWGDVSPVTRRIDSRKVYRRNKDKKVKDADWD